MSTEYKSYLSPLSWRYGSQEMRQLWSEINKRLLWRRIWLALAEVQAEFELFPAEMLSPLRQHVNKVDMQRSLEIEAQIHHDLMAELMVYAEQAGESGGVLHLGATSADIQDNADVLRMRQSVDILIPKLDSLLTILTDSIERYAELPVMAFTHLQPAEPTTLGYRLAFFAQDLLADRETLHEIAQGLKGKGFKGATGTAGSYVELLGAHRFAAFEKRLSERLGLPFFTITTQVYPRKQDYQVVCALAGMGATLYKFAFDLRILQSPLFGEWSEPFGEQQVGSSAMPFKRNPVNAEKIDSLGRQLAQLPRLAWDNAAHSLLERTLDDSANRRSLLPEAFLISDEMLRVCKKMVSGLEIQEAAIKRNLAVYAPFAAIERLLIHSTKAGADRQEMHAHLRAHAMQAWKAIIRGEENPLKEVLLKDEKLRTYLSIEEIGTLMEARDYVGDAPHRARLCAEQIRAKLLGTGS